MVFRAALLILLASLTSASLAQPVVHVTSPNGGENWLLGSTHNVTWTDNLTGNFDIQLFRGTTFELSIATGAPNTGSYTWQIPEDLAEGNDFRVKIISLLSPTTWDYSDTVFTLSQPPSLHLISPNGGETWCAGDSAHITWTSVNVEEQIRIEIKRSYPGGAWTTLVNSMENSGDYPWVVAGPSTFLARVRIRGVVHGTYSDTSDANFAIEPPFGTPNVVINAVDSAYVLRWQAMGCLDHYEVWNTNDADGEFALVTTTTDTLYNVNMGQLRKQFYYVVAVRE